MDPTTATPAEIDGAMSPLATAEERARVASIRWGQLATAAPEGVARDQYMGSFKQSCAAYDEAVAAQELLRAEWEQRGGWTRAYLVVTSGRGHVHSSTGCSTCHPSTSFCLLPEVSGLSEDEIVALAGNRACSVCYPTAPVEVLLRPTQLFTPDERAAQVARAKRNADRAERKVRKVAAAITMPDGSALRDAEGFRIETEATAQRLYIDSAAYLLAVQRGYPNGRESSVRRFTVAVLIALAGKRGSTVKEVIASLEPKVEARYRRDYAGFNREAYTVEGVS